jgi:hypothetical protein
LTGASTTELHDRLRRLRSIHVVAAAANPGATRELEAGIENTEAELQRRERALAREENR